MIAVFGNDREVRITHWHPKKMFRRITTVEDLRGIRWSGVILIYGWDDDRMRCLSYDYLELIQPELFK